MSRTARVSGIARTVGSRPEYCDAPTTPSDNGADVAVDHGRWFVRLGARVGVRRPRRTDPITVHLMVLALAGFAAVAIVYVSVTQFPLADATVNDSLQYAAMTAHAPWATIAKPFRWRVLEPLLAGLGPHSDPGRIQVVWGVLDALCLTLAAWFEFLVLRRGGRSTATAVLVAMLFFSSWVVLRYAGMVLVDAASYLFLAAGVYAAVARRPVLLFAVVSVGMFVKETTVLVVLLVVLLGTPRAQRLRQLALCVPGVAGYVALRLATPTDLGYTYGVSRVLEAFGTLGTARGALLAAAEFALTFGPLWILAVVGWARAPAAERILPRRTAWIVLLVLLVPYLIGSNLGRVWFLAFPVVLAFAADGIDDLFRRAHPPSGT